MEVSAAAQAAPCRPLFQRELSMNSSKSRPRPVVISCQAAQVLGYTRTATQTLTARYVSAAFPALNAQELSSAIGELLDKELLTQKGSDDKATYSLTEYGRSGRVAVA
jgi:hypothetical protein